MKQIFYSLGLIMILTLAGFLIKQSVKAQNDTGLVPAPQVVGRISGSKPGETLKIGLYIQMPKPYDYGFEILRKNPDNTVTRTYLSHYNLVTDMAARGELTLPIKDNPDEYYTDWIYYYDPNIQLGSSYTYTVSALLGARKSSSVDYSVTVKAQKEPIITLSNYMTDYRNHKISWDKVCSCLGPVYYKVYRDWVIEAGASTEDSLTNNEIIPNHYYQIEVYAKD